MDDNIIVYKNRRNTRKSRRKRYTVNQGEEILEKDIS